MLTLACVDVCDILLSLAVVVILVLGVLYMGVRLGIAALAHSAQSGPYVGKPWSLFAAALVVPAALNVMLLHALLSWRSQDSGWELAGWAVVLALLAALPAALSSAEPLQQDASAKPSRAVWLQDLLLAAFAFAAALFVLSQCFPALRHNAADFFQAALAIAFFQAEGFALAVHLCRRSTLGQRPRFRAEVFGLVLMLMPVAFLALSIAWFMWREALKRARSEQAVLT